MSDSWQRAKSIFQAALEQPANNREAFVRESCADPVLSQVLGMLQSHFEDPDFLQPPLQSDGNVDPMLGRQLGGVGGFTIGPRIAQGGMGTVYEATQANPVRRVAIKLLRHDFHIAESALQRFQNESELLAKMHHPGIAQVFESGTLVDGSEKRPWFAMELVDGQSLDRILASKKSGNVRTDESTNRRLNRPWTERQTLELLIRICDAVHHAHSRSVIHRDLKPGNILICDNPSQATNEKATTLVPKIVDFGIAKISDLQFNGQLTATQDILGTLNYLSPEQVTGDRNLVDQRCDIFSLGVIAFELLTGKLPHQRQSTSMADTVSRITNDDMMKLGDIDRHCAKDLETIIAKAMMLDPGQRYLTANAFAEDLKRYFSQEPILARPPTWFYRSSKFVKRNRLLVAASLTTMLALATGIVVYASVAKQAKKTAAEARYESSKAVAVSSFITNDFMTRLLNAVAANADKPFEMVQLVDESAQQIDNMFGERPLIEAAIRNEVGTIYYNIQAFEKGAQQYQTALHLWETQLGPSHPDTLKAVNNLAQSKMAMGANAETEKLFRRAYQGRRRALGESNEATLRSLSNLAELLRRQERFDEAEALFMQGLSVRKDSLAQDDKTTLTMAMNLGSLYIVNDKVEQGLQLQQEAFATAADVYGASHAFALQVGIRFVQSLDRAKKYDQALATILPLVQHYERFAANEPNQLVIPYRLLARIYRHQGHKTLAREKLKFLLEASKNSERDWGDAVGKIKRDLRRLDRD